MLIQMAVNQMSETHICKPFSQGNCSGFSPETIRLRSDIVASRGVFTPGLGRNSGDASRLRESVYEFWSRRSEICHAANWVSRFDGDFTCRDQQYEPGTPPDADAPEGIGCYFERGRTFCSRYCYIEVDGHRFCRERPREARSQAPVEGLPIIQLTPMK